MPPSYILFEADSSGVAVLTINRPEKRNALSAEVIGELAEAIENIAADPSVRGAMITGAGDRAFVAGGDIAELAGLSPAGVREYIGRGQALLRRIETLGKPTVAAVNGHALGGGMELAMACSVRFAAETARLGMPEVKLGAIPGYGGCERLPRLVGRGRALELMLSGEPISAQEAHRIGLVNAVVPPGELLGFSRAWLASVAANAPLAMRLAMEAVDVGLDSGLEAGQRFEAAAFSVCAASEDYREGMRAFLEKRRAVFAGR
jgi:enoyl-CoA hydratase